MLDNHYDDPRDRAVLGLTPMLMAPRFGKLAPVSLGLYRYVAAADGIYQEARSHALDVSLRVSDGQFPYGERRAHVRLTHGPIPQSLLDTCIAAARRSLPNEWGGLIVAEDDGYRLVMPEPTAVSPDRLRYDISQIDPARIALDIHSHGTGGAYFSPVDDADDRGFWLAAVIGRLDRPEPEMVCRLCLHGRHLPIGWTPWEAAA